MIIKKSRKRGTLSSVRIHPQKTERVYGTQTPLLIRTEATNFALDASGIGDSNVI